MNVEYDKSLVGLPPEQTDELGLDLRVKMYDFPVQNRNPHLQTLGHRFTEYG
jgi:hypothetical protein